MGSVTADIYGSSPVPRAVSALLQQRSPSSQAGFSSDGTLGWLLVAGQLCLWRCQDGVDARVITIRLPSQLLTAQRLFASVLAGAQHATALVSTDTGLIVAWPNVDYSSEPLLHQVPIPASTQPAGDPGPAARVCAFTAVAPALSSGMLFVAALSTQDGSCFLVQGNQQGMHSRQLATGAAPTAPESRSVLSVLGRAVASAYTEAFDRNAKFIKHSASGKPALSITARIVDIHHLHVYVLTDTTLDCWQVTVGMRLSEQLLWSAQTVLVASSAAAARLPQSATNAGLAVCGDAAYLLLAHRPTDGTPPSYWVHAMLLKPDSTPVHLGCSQLPGCGPQQQSLDLRAIYAAPSKHVVLVMDARRHLYEWCMEEQGDHPAGCALVSDDPDTLAAASLGTPQPGVGDQPPEVCWLVLNATYGVVQLRVGSARPAQQAATAPLLSLAAGPGARELSAEQKVQVQQVLDAQLAQAASVAAASQPLLPLSLGLRCRLAALGVTDSAAAAGVLAEYSTALVDALPKQWALGAGMGGLPAQAGGAGSHSLTAGLLSAKEAKHVLLLQCLAEGGLLHALPPNIIRSLAENGEKLSAAGRVLALHAYVAAQQQQQESEGAAQQVPLTVQVIYNAGARLSQASPHEALPPVELFYSRPSASLPALLAALGEAAAAVQEQARSGLGRPGDASSAMLAQHCCSLGALLGEVVAAVSARREAVASAYRIVSGQLYRQLQAPPWLADDAARDAMAALTQACQAVRQLLLAAGSGAASEGLALPRQQLARMMFGCTEVLLSSCAAAVSAAQGADDQQAVLLVQYASLRESCLATLLEDARAELDPWAPLPQDSLLLQVLQLAAAHHCYPVLFTACQRVDSWGEGQGAMQAAGSGTGPSLHHHMAHLTAEEGAQPADTFARYCFQQLLNGNRAADLLQLPQTFWPDLRAFLQQQPQHASLLWPLLLRMQEWGGALQALVQDAQAHKDAYKQQHRLYCLAKLCARQASDASTASAIASRLQLLAIQEALLQLPGAEAVCFPRGVFGDQCPALEPEQLVPAALKLEQQQQQQQEEVAGNRGRAATLALHALALCPPDVQQAHRSWLHSAWQQLLRATNWAALAAAHDNAGGEGAYTDSLQVTPLFQATLACRQGGLFGQGGGVSDTGRAQDTRNLIRQLAQGDAAMLQHGMQAFELALQLQA